MLCVRESTRRMPTYNILTGMPIPDSWEGVYTADAQPVQNHIGFDYVWWYSKPSCPSIHMPAFAERIHRPILEVRQEKLGDISEEDAIDEGITCVDGQWGVWLPCGGGRATPFATTDPRGPRQAYRHLFEHPAVNGPGSWDAQTLVWVIRFERRTQRAWREVE